MSLSRHLRTEALFAHIPSGPAPPPSRLHDPAQIDVLSDSELVDCTYLVLKHEELSVLQALKVWHLRLTVLLFSNRLGEAKKEATNLNNALYAKENPSTATAGVAPLPKNNNGVIDHELLVLLLRLKSVPNLSLVNELYKLSYQLRLKCTSSDRAAVQKKLCNLAYEIMMVLFITRNYGTLVSFVESLRHDLGDSESDFASNTALVGTLVKLVLGADAAGDYAHVRQRSLDCLTHVLQTIPHTVGAKEVQASVDTSYAGLCDLVARKMVTGRILCCTLAMWELSTVFRVEMSPGSFAVECAGGGSLLEDAYARVCRRWSSNIHKVYAIE